ncbi:uncharacterized protein LOC132382206 [Hypanus sabinus]|uniref:uncharacterized protein LOC132382206 n=1 Tax=Hypanus sabinus TaxID=79690 RepID=UPI0028C3A945|nr:uncharacterized protein LOC132382206 [Hypanus sabinus]
MAEEKKLKLKRRRAASLGQPRELSPKPRQDIEQPAPERKELSATVSTWFDDNDINETDHIWAVMMKSMFPDMKGSDWKTIRVPDLPLSPEKIPKCVESIATETISVGDESFMWTPFPPAVVLEERSRSDSLFSHRGIAANKGEWTNSTELCIDRSQPPPSEIAQDKGALSSAEATKYLSIQSKNYLGNVKASNSFEADPVRFCAEQAGRKQNVYPVDVGHKADNAPPSPAKSLQKTNPEPMQPTPFTEKLGQEKTKQHKMPAGGTVVAEEEDDIIITGEWQSHSFPENRLCATNMMNHKDAVTTGRSDGHVEGGLDLESCPMCLLQFPAGFTQLEVDSHLAKCLSESTEDVMW